MRKTDDFLAFKARYSLIMRVSLAIDSQRGSAFWITYCTRNGNEQRSKDFGACSDFVQETLISAGTWKGETFLLSDFNSMFTVFDKR
jgi:hypothetical protein